MPIDVVRDVRALPSWSKKAFPPLRTVVSVPVFSRAGRLIKKPGYDSESQLWYQPSKGFAVPDLPNPIGPDAITEASDLISKELLGDFPFESEADRWNAVTCFLTPFVREMFDGPTPLIAIDAPVAGTGKGLLTKAITMPFLGYEPAFSGQPENDAEWRKVITAQLQSSPHYVVFDNSRGILNSPSLEAVITSTVWQDRLLGTSTTVTAANRTVFMLTGNNLQIGGDLPRRVVPVRLNAKMERPDERPPNRFRHPDLVAWIKSNRGKLVWAACVLISHWIQKGRPRSETSLASFEDWATTLGGIVGEGGKKFFLQNISVRAARDEGGAEWHALCQVWWAAAEGNLMTVAELYPLLEPNDLLPWITNAEESNKTGRRQRFGHALKKMVGRVFGGFQIIDSGECDSRSGAKQYCLEWIAEGPPPSAAEGGDGVPYDGSYKGTFEDLLDA